MRRFFVILLFFLISQCVYIASEAQTEETCAELMTVEIDIDLEPFDYIWGCETGYDCISEKYLLCQLQLATELLETCTEDDLFCKNEAFLNTTSLFIYDNPYGFNYSWNPQQTLLDNFPQALVAFSAQDFENALGLLQPDNIAHPLLSYSRGLVYEMLNQPDNALQEYTEALRLVPNHMLIHYTRGLLYGRLGRTTEASFETAWIEDYLTAFAPDLLPLVTPLTDVYPLDMSRFSSWVKYPLMIKGFGPMGEFYSDMTQVPETSVQIAIYDELDIILTIDVAELRYPRSTGDILNTYVMQETDNGNYEYDFHIDWSEYDTMQLEFRDGLIFGQEYLPGAESYTQAEFILAPSDYPDPRESFGKPICEGGVISRLRPGMSVTEMAYRSEFYYSENVGEEGNPNLYFDTSVRVTDNFVCLDDVLWWEVIDENGNTGWHAENQGSQYMLRPRDDLQDIMYCPHAPTTRLYIQAEGRVLEGLGSNNLRTEPNPDAELVGQIPEGEQFTVLDGPVCMNEMAWWQVDYNGLVGWTAEGDNEGYWLEPILPW